MKSVKTSHSNIGTLPKKNILGVGVTDASKKTILEFLLKNLNNHIKPYYVVTPNPEMVVLANKNPDFKDVLNNAKIATNDGVGVGLAAQLMATPLNERFTGVDLMKSVCEASVDWPITVGFLGGGPKVAEKTSECFRSEYPNLKVAFAAAEWPDGSLGKKEKTKLPTTNYQLQPTDVVDILFVALGVPKQEFWMAEHVGKIPVKVMVGVGGAFDQIVDPSLKPPDAVGSLGFGWLYRLIRQPWRWKRQLALVEFLWLLLQKKLSL